MTYNKSYKLVFDFDNRNNDNDHTKRVKIHEGLGVCDINGISKRLGVIPGRKNIESVKKYLRCCPAINMRCLAIVASSMKMRSLFLWPGASSFFYLLVSTIVLMSLLPATRAADVIRIGE